MPEIRNFAIIAHVDHGKSTLADRLLELTHVVTKAEAQTLDSNPIEKERGITISLAPVQMKYERDGKEYILNLVDTPGHVDFAYEVSRALAACEGAILLVDATQGIQAQTLANYMQAQKLGLIIIPVINKVDLPSADVEGTLLQMIELLNVHDDDILQISAKTGLGVESVLDTVIDKIPSPQGLADEPFRALVFNSDYLQHQGVRIWVKVVDGVLQEGMSLYSMGGGRDLNAQEVGVFTLESVVKDSLEAGQVGYLISGLKDPRMIQAGDTLIERSRKNQTTSDQALPGYKPPQPMVFLSLYPIDSADFHQLTQSLDKLRLVDSSLTYTPESSPLLGHGYRVGFLGLLHAEIVQERLHREFDLEVFGTTPSVTFRILQSGEYKVIETPSLLPDPSTFEAIEEPVLSAIIFVPHAYLGGILELMREKRGKLVDMQHIGSQVKLEYDLPLMEMVGDFYSRLKSISSGFASMDYSLKGWQQSDLVKVDFLLAGERIAVLSQILPRDSAQTIGRRLVEKLAELIPRHQFEIAIQAALGGKILARATIKAFRKDVTAKLYGGDQTRKDKLLEKQKKGKKRMKQMGRVSIPPDTFWKLLQ